MVVETAVGIGVGDATGTCLIVAVRVGVGRNVVLVVVTLMFCSPGGTGEATYSTAPKEAGFMHPLIKTVTVTRTVKIPIAFHFLISRTCADIVYPS